MNKLIPITAGLIWFALGSANVWQRAMPASAAPKRPPVPPATGEDGNSVNPEWPSLAGQGEAYIIKQLTEFKAGVRVNAMMSGMRHL